MIICTTIVLVRIYYGKYAGLKAAQNMTETGKRARRYVVLLPVE